MRILLVDDEALLVKVTALMLEKIGCKPIAVTSSRDALQRFKDTPDEFDALITDLNMPNMSGEELAREVRLINPNLPVMISSGKARGFDDCDQGGPTYLVLNKPFSLKELSQAISQISAAMDLSNDATLPKC